MIATRVATYQMNEEEILERTFSFLVKHGLENITIRELCRGTGLAQGTLYYWFEDKTNIICESTEYGLRRVTDDIFRYVFVAMGDLRVNVKRKCTKRASENVQFRR